MVRFSWMPSVSDMLDHRADVNWAPLSEVIILGTPKREIQLYIKAETSVGVEMSGTGMASGHRVKRSTIVKR